MAIEYHAQQMSDGRVMWWITEVIVVKDGWADTKAEACEAAQQWAKENEMELEATIPAEEKETTCSQPS